MNKKHLIIMSILITTLFVLTACQPQIETVEIKETVVVEKEVTPVPEEEAEEPEIESIRVAFIFPGLINDGSYNTQGFQAAQQVAELEYVEEMAYVEGKGVVSDASAAMRDYAFEGYDVIWAHSGAFGSTTEDLALEFPDTTWIKEGRPSDRADQLTNVWYAGADWDDAYFVAGALAGLMTESNVIGYVGGIEFSLYAACSTAFAEGATHVNPDVNVLSSFTGSFDDPVLGKETAIGMIEEGADILIHTMNAGAFGLFEAAKEADHQVWVIGKDIDQVVLAPEVILSSVILDYNMVMTDIIERIIQGEDPDTVWFNMISGYAYLAPFYGNVPGDVVDQVSEITEQMINGEIEYSDY